MTNFTKNFYENQIKEQECIQGCYNTRMRAHFGSTAESKNLLLDFSTMKKEFQRYESWHPRNRLMREYNQEYDAEYFHKISHKLLEKTNSKKYNKFAFN